MAFNKWASYSFVGAFAISILGSGCEERAVLKFARESQSTTDTAFVPEVPTDGDQNTNPETSNPPESPIQPPGTPPDAPSDSSPAPGSGTPPVTGPSPAPIPPPAPGTPPAPPVTDIEDDEDDEAKLPVPPGMDDDDCDDCDDGCKKHGIKRKTFHRELKLFAPRHHEGLHLIRKLSLSTDSSGDHCNYDRSFTLGTSPAKQRHQEVSLRRCDGFLAAREVKASNGGSCTTQEVTLRKRSFFGFESSRVLAIDSDCLCYSARVWSFRSLGYHIRKRFADAESCKKYFDAWAKHYEK